MTTFGWVSAGLGLWVAVDVAVLGGLWWLSGRNIRRRRRARGGMVQVPTHLRIVKGGHR